ncbi:MAG: radical SAM family heme chaperone HemW [Caldicoprobacterales bacterium]
MIKNRTDSCMKKIGLYLHFPFCVQKCRYCDFSSWTGKENLMNAYLSALAKELETYQNSKEKAEVSSIFMGGGTPTLFDGEALAKVLDISIKCFNVETDAEISIECNPGTADIEKLRKLYDSGFNRLSIGLQAWQDHLLDFLGRIHRSGQFEDTVNWAKKSGFLNISADVIYGIPGQTLDDWMETLEAAVSYDIKHLSAYSLKVEEGTVFYQWKKQGRFKEMDDDLERQMYHEGIKFLESRGFLQYEISNFAQPGYESRHNLNYWMNGQYIGCGSGAHSYYNNFRRANIASIEEYIKRIENRESVTAYQEAIDRETEIFETLMLGLRLKAGISKKAFADRFGFVLEERYSMEIERLRKQGLLAEDKDSIYPTAKGFDFQNKIALEFLK